MKRILFTVIIGILLIGCQKKEAFYLNDEYYHKGSLIEIDSEEFKTLEKNKNSFVIFVYQPLCTTSYDFHNVVTEFLDTYQISFYKTSFSTIKDTNMIDYIKYCPSAVIYRNGEMVAYLDASKDKHLPYYESVSGFKEWLTKYILLKDDLE